jgi:hypothetical protein
VADRGPDLLRRLGFVQKVKLVLERTAQLAKHLRGTTNNTNTQADSHEVCRMFDTTFSTAGRLEKEEEDETLGSRKVFFVLGV